MATHEVSDSLSSPSPWRLSAESDYILLDYSEGNDSVQLEFPRVGVGFHYPVWRLPLAGHSSFGVEWAKLSFGNHRSSGYNVEVEAVSDPTLYCHQDLELDLADVGPLNFSLFVRGALSLFPKTFDDYHVQLSQNNRQVDITTLTREHIEEVAYKLLDLDAGARLQYFGLNRFKPYFLTGFSRLHANIFVDYRESGRALMKAAHISHQALNRGRFEFEENFWNAALGAQILLGRHLLLELEGRVIPFDTSLLTHIHASLSVLLGEK